MQKIALYADGSRCGLATTTRDCPQPHRWITARSARQLATDAAEYDRLIGTMADVEAAILADAPLT